MQTVNEAINVLQKNVKGAKPVSYWVKDSAYVFRLASNTEVVGCNYFIVDGEKVIGTNPMQIDLDVSDMKHI